MDQLKNQVTTDSFGRTLRRELNAKMGFLSDFRWLSRFGPVFGVHGKNVQVLHEPSQFYQMLNTLTLKAEKRITLAALYLGTGDLEAKFVQNLRLAVAKNPGKLQLTVLLDYTRGSRGGECSSRTMLTPLIDEFGSQRVRVSLYHSPFLRGLVRWLPHKWNEVIGLQHIKVYIFDDNVILSGANLSDQYFEQRQDRYVLFQNAPELANYYSRLVDTVGKFSFHLDSANRVTIDDTRRMHPYQTSLDKFIRNTQKLLNDFVRPNKRPEEEVTFDTHVYPLVQMGQLNFGNDHKVTSEVLKLSPEGSQVRLATGYFNLVPDYEDLIIRGKSSFDVLTAHPRANSFYKVPGFMYYIPVLYTQLLKLFYLKTEFVRDRIRIWEYYREGWTFHGKGMWYYPPGESKPVMTLIGSPNFGYRSIYRDLESQVIIVTENEDLRNRLENEQKTIYKTVVLTDEMTFKDPERFVPFWVAYVTAFVRGFF
ncbi:CDP-diacylglycerol--glycerol-3-phosphate 3-phosphatidyltransferase, mitochondrial-like isoform X2 [Varroa jacobsoni]|uniref:CDP-diacylglycerol--glycerol-3-phosphate 3-phosphatidyltransferase n=1 Tax=Varroa destructor TaxID=109461 RepID=A0A7M7K3B1_VARDE|nr:CDP-diacylglycerol--glycerol-3-phosphate 3-phosphatidyltransferase, mitochondrial-like isoform X2 [Varroa destructor]XP_022686349.1 CDP-diacylglycerol--glycerol-3-phosphate 3-phosphatidyltransferase, mitochondrial-like isoform X2 [Varroa jacobsoni]